MKYLKFLFIFFVFAFISCNNSNNKKAKKNNYNTIQISKEVKNKIDTSYIFWVNKMVETGNYLKCSTVENFYSLAYRDGEPEPPDSFWDTCRTGLPDSVFIDKHYGDINQDGIIDCSGRIWPIFCNTKVRFNDIHLFILSKPDSNYYVVFEPKEISENIGPAGTLDSILPDGTLKYKAVYFSSKDAMCCPSIEKDLYYVLNEKKYVVDYDNYPSEDYPKEHNKTELEQAKSTWDNLIK